MSHSQLIRTIRYETESSWTATAGTHTLRWELDFRNELLEPDESNNGKRHPPGTWLRLYRSGYPLGVSDPNM